MQELKIKKVCVTFRNHFRFFILGKWDPDTITIAEGITGMTINILRCIEDPATQVCGIRILLDVKGASFKQIRCVTPRFMTLFSKALRVRKTYFFPLRLPIDQSQPRDHLPSKFYPTNHNQQFVYILSQPIKIGQI